MAAQSKAALGPTRSLHWVFKVADRAATIEFYTKTLGMTPLRHEEFEEGCAAACNGPYDNKWSKTMIGYGDEDSQFVLELTCNYMVKSYLLGNDYGHIVIRSKRAFEGAKAHSSSRPVPDPAAAAAGGVWAGGVEAVHVEAPGGYGFVVVDRDVPGGSTVMTELCLHVSDLAKSLAFWSGFLGFAVVAQQAQGGGAEAVVLCAAGQAVLRLTQLPAGQALDRGSAYGRVAFSTPGALLQQLETDVKAAGYTVHTPYVSLDTPGKATVQVVILQDPDGHEICFVGDEGFRDLSRADPQAGQLLTAALEADTSQAWVVRLAAKAAAKAAEAAAAGRVDSTA